MNACGVHVGQIDKAWVYAMNDRILITTLCFAVFSVLFGITGCRTKAQTEEPQPPVHAAINQEKPEEAHSAQSNLTSCPLVPNSPLFTEGQVVQMTLAAGFCNEDEDGERPAYPYLFRAGYRCLGMDVSISEQSCKVHLLNASSESCDAQFVCSKEDEKPIILTITKNEISWEPYPETNNEATGVYNELVFQESSKESCKCPSECDAHCKAEPPECGLCEAEIECDCTAFQNEESCKKCEECIYNSFSIFCTTRSGTFREGDVWSSYGEGDGEFEEGDLIIFDPRGLFAVETNNVCSADAVHIRTPDYQCTSEDEHFCPKRYRTKPGH